MPEGQILEFSGLTKRFGAVTAVENFTARVEPGVVTGFLGPNGAGKTTTLRMLLGLVRATEGEATIGGVPYAKLRDPLRTVGAALEASSFHPGRTAYNHLKVYAHAARLPLTRVDESLATVGLSEVAGRKVGGFSLGMRQRLGLAYALLGDPGVLVLDEPVNGLDPEGIKWMRGLLRTLASQGRTVLVSSHLLTEVQQTVDNLVIISKGRLVYQGSLTELAYADDALVVVDSPERAALADAFTTANLDFDVLRSGLNVRGHEPVELGRIALAAGIPLSGLQRKGGGLEEIFLELVSGVRTHPSADGIVAPVADDVAEATAELDTAAAVAPVAAVLALAPDNAVVDDAVFDEAPEEEALAQGSLGFDDDEDEAEAEIEAQAEALEEDVDEVPQSESDAELDVEAATAEAEAAVAASLAAEFAAESGVTPGAAASAGAAAEVGAMAWAVHSDGETEAIETGSIPVISAVPGTDAEPDNVDDNVDAAEDEGETAWAVHADGETESIRTASISVIVADDVEAEADPHAEPESEGGPQSEPDPEPESEAPVDAPATASFDDLLFGRSADEELSDQAPAHADASSTETLDDEPEDEQFEDEHLAAREHPHRPAHKTESDLDADRFFAAFSDEEGPSEESSDMEPATSEPRATVDDTDEHPRTDEEGGESR